jgi:hypothetical protein
MTPPDSRVVPQLSDQAICATCQQPTHGVLFLTLHDPRVFCSRKCLDQADRPSPEAA